MDAKEQKLDTRTLVGSILTFIGAFSLIVLYAFDSYIVPVVVFGALLMAIGLVLGSDVLRKTP